MYSSRSALSPGRACLTDMLRTVHQGRNCTNRNMNVIRESLNLCPLEWMTSVWPHLITELLPTLHTIRCSPYHVVCVRVIYIYLTLYTLMHNSYIHTYIHRYIHTYIHTHIHTYIHTYCFRNWAKIIQDLWN